MGAALDLAGLDRPARLRPARPLGTYPTLLTDTGLVVKLFGDRWCGPESHQTELEAYQVLDGHDLPVPGWWPPAGCCPMPAVAGRGRS